MTNKSLILVGDSYFAEIAYEYFTHDSEYNVKAFAVEKEFRDKDQLFGLPVVDLENIEHDYPPDTHEAFIALTYAQLNRVRTRLCSVMKDKGYSLASYVSSEAFVWSNVEIGENVFIFEDNTVQPFVKIGNNTILWSGNHIGHHSTIKNNVFISSHVVISGLVTVGDNCFIGVNSTVANDVCIGQDCFLGAACMIAKDLPDKAFAKSQSADIAKIDTHKYFRLNS